MIRIRADKGHPNGFITARNVFISIFEENITKEFLIDTLCVCAESKTEFEWVTN